MMFWSLVFRFDGKPGLRSVTVYGRQEAELLRDDGVKVRLGHIFADVDVRTCSSEIWTIRIIPRFC
jgi:hypothetical protein